MRETNTTIICCDASFQPGTKICGWAYIISHDGQLYFDRGVHNNVSNSDEAEFTAVAFALLKTKALNIVAADLHCDNSAVVSGLRKYIWKKEHEKLPHWFVEQLETTPTKLNIHHIKGHPKMITTYTQTLHRLVDLQSKHYKDIYDTRRNKSI